uniref:Uncharacterized protein n=1 Tax=Utricularia reniformis TaxID=192314 RepID=A0A1Y0B2U2_9LAMI|nr:hypothetical protein AEK19_MT1479 [Utricularia reniformis]ART31669.1 hypothetical protein AEK19_MT1479 [Utricularia reniformis]
MSLRTEDVVAFLSRCVAEIDRSLYRTSSQDRKLIFLLRE